MRRQCFAPGLPPLSLAGLAHLLALRVQVRAHLYKAHRPLTQPSSPALWRRTPWVVGWVCAQARRCRPTVIPGRAKATASHLLQPGLASPRLNCAGWLCTLMGKADPWIPISFLSTDKNPRSRHGNYGNHKPLIIEKGLFIPWAIYTCAHLHVTYTHEMTLLPQPHSPSRASSCC